MGGSGSRALAATRLYLSLPCHILGVRQSALNGVVRAATHSRYCGRGGCCWHCDCGRHALMAPSDSKGVFSSTTVAAEPGSHSSVCQPLAQQLPAVWSERVNVWPAAERPTGQGFKKWSSC